MENGISIFIGIIAALATYAILWLVYLKPKQTKLEAERDMAKQLNASLTAQRDTANEEQAALERKLEQEEQRIAGFESELEMAKQSNAVLQNRLEQEEQRRTQLDSQLNAEERRSANLQSQLNAEEQHSASLQSQLNAEKEHSANLQSQLNAEKQRSANLQSQLNAEKEHSANLQSQLNAEKEHSANLQSQLNTAEKDITDLQSQLNAEKEHSANLQSQLNQTTQNYNDAIYLLYLSTLSLQACGIALRRELDRSKRLDEEYRGLADRYNDLLANYQDFSEDVKSKARQRLVRRGIGVVLAFVPGLALIDILGDLGDILDVATEADAAVDGLYPVASDDIVKSAASSSETPEVSESGMPIEGVSFLPLIPRAQTGIEGTLQQNVSMERTTREPSDLDAFVADILQYMKALVNSLTDDEHREAIVEMINNLQKLGYKLPYPSPTIQNRREGKSK